MKRVIRTVLFHFLCIIVFSLCYFYFKHEFKCEEKEEFTIIDCILFSTTIQSGVGITDIYPISFYGKLIMLIQQLLMIMAHVFTLYIFTI
jgi:hypothetical protein